MENQREVTEYCLDKFREIEHELTLFKDQVRSWFETHPKLTKVKPVIVHSVKHRLKDHSHIAGKVRRKLARIAEETGAENNGPADPHETFLSFTDLAGVRVLLLHQKQFEPVHNEISKKIASGDWVLYEDPKAYTWDPDSAEYFKLLGIDTKIKESHYTSVHYVVRPRRDSELACEIQVRTLFEEIWGEVDHTLNYPEPTNNTACREQLRVLAKVVGAGSRLVDSIFHSAEHGLVAEISLPIDIEVEPAANMAAETMPTTRDEPPTPPTEKPESKQSQDGDEDKPEVEREDPPNLQV